MLIGHFAAGMAAKKWAPKSSLGSLFIACQFLDLLWPVFMLLGWERATIDHSLPTFNALNLLHIPLSHGLVESIFWSLLVFASVFGSTKSMKTSIVFGLVVFSHWILDFLTHIPDLPLVWEAPKFGLGLWKSKLGTSIVELGLFVVAIWIYLKARPKAFNRKSLILFVSMISFLLLIYGLHVLGPKPPESSSPILIAGPAFSLLLVALWAHHSDQDTSK